MTAPAFRGVVCACAVMLTLAACGGGNEQTDGQSTSTTDTAASSSTTAERVDAQPLIACLRDVGAEPERSTDNELYAPLVTDPGFEASIDAWRGTTTVRDYDSIYLFVFKDRGALERALAAFDDPALKIKLINRWNVLWTWAGPVTERIPDEQVDTVNGCLVRAAA